MILEKITSRAAFHDLQSEWNSALADSGADCLFLTWEWLYTWWKHLSEERKLSILALRSGQTLVAIAPLAVRGRQWGRLVPYRSLEFLGTGSVGSDYLDLIIRRGKIREALDTLSEAISREDLAVHLSHLRLQGTAAAELANCLEVRGWNMADAKGEVCPFIDLSQHSWQSYLASLGSEHRYSFQRKLRNLEKRFAVRFRQASSEEERRIFLDRLIDLHTQRWRDRGGSSAFHTSALVAFHHEFSRLALDRGWLRLFVLSLNETPVAALYGFRYGPVFYFYQSGFAPEYGRHGVGVVTMGLAIRSAIAEGAAEYDFLRGEEAYKFHWARGARQLHRLELYGPRTRGLCRQQAARWGRSARSLARYVLDRAVAPRPTADEALPAKTHVT